MLFTNAKYDEINNESSNEMFVFFFSSVLDLFRFFRLTTATETTNSGRNTITGGIECIYFISENHCLAMFGELQYGVWSKQQRDRQRERDASTRVVGKKKLKTKLKTLYHVPARSLLVHYYLFIYATLIIIQNIRLKKYVHMVWTIFFILLSTESFNDDRLKSEWVLDIWITSFEMVTPPRSLHTHIDNIYFH